MVFCTQPKLRHRVSAGLLVQCTNYSNRRTGRGLRLETQSHNSQRYTDHVVIMPRTKQTLNKSYLQTPCEILDWILERKRDIMKDWGTQTKAVVLSTVIGNSTLSLVAHALLRTERLSLPPPIDMLKP